MITIVQSQEVETRVFQTEVNRLLDIIINSLYSQKEIFLREAISNASDSLDKIRFLSKTDSSLLNDEPDLNIKIRLLPDEETIIIEDTGIGMSKEELINNLGTIAKSGTTQFLEHLSNNKDLNLIGQFGVGFYSYFLIADKVIVVSKSVGNEQYIWESEAGSTFTIKKDTEGPFLTRGSKIILKVKKDAKEFLETKKIKELIKRYSQFINFDIFLYESKVVSKGVEEDVVETTATDTDTETEKSTENQDPSEKRKKTEEKDNFDELIDEDSEKNVTDEKSAKKTKKVEETVWDWEKQNDVKALWLRPSTEIQETEYQEFYKSFSKDYDNPSTWLHFKAEGGVEFTALLYIPSHTPSSLFEEKKEEEKESNLKLYVRRVLISDQFTDLLPAYLNFVKGVVDSDDLPLNVSRESLQKLRSLKTIKNKLTKKVLDKLERILNEKIDVEDVDVDSLNETEKKELEERNNEKRKELRELYRKIWKNFGRSLKIGINEDTSNRNKIAELLLFHSSAGDEMTTLNAYIERMKPDQKDIYYIGGENLDSIKVSPMAVGITRKGFEVLYMDDPVDEYVIQLLGKFKDKQLTNIAKTGFELPTSQEEKSKLDKLKKYYAPLTKWMKEVLSDFVENVNVSLNVIEHPMIVLATQSGFSANYEKLAKAQASAYKDERLSYLEKLKRNIEINPYHPFIKELLERVKDSPDEDAKESATLLYEIALMNSGYSVKDQVKFTKRFYQVMGDSLGLQRNLGEVTVDLSEYDEEKLAGINSEDLHIPSGDSTAGDSIPKFEDVNPDEL